MREYTRNPRLPKADLINFRLYRHDWLFRTYRIANARDFFILGFLWITIRRPWLKHSAMALYPHLMKYYRD